MKKIDHLTTRPRILIFTDIDSNLMRLAVYGTVLIFFSAHLVFITAERSVMKRHI